MSNLRAKAKERLNRDRWDGVGGGDDSGGGSVAGLPAGGMQGSQQHNGSTQRHDVALLQLRRGKKRPRAQEHGEFGGDAGATTSGAVEDYDTATYPADDDGAGGKGVRGHVAPESGRCRGLSARAGMEATPGKENQTDADGGAAADADTYVQVGFTPEKLQRKESRRQNRATRIQRALEHRPEVPCCVRASTCVRELMRACMRAHIRRHRAGVLAQLRVGDLACVGARGNDARLRARLTPTYTLVCTHVCTYTHAHVHARKWKYSHQRAEALLRPLRFHHYCNGSLSHPVLLSEDEWVCPCCCCCGRYLSAKSRIMAHTVPPHAAVPRSHAP